MSGRHTLGAVLKHRMVTESQRQQTTRAGTVISLRPFTIELFDYAIPLVYDEDFQLSQWAKQYQTHPGFKVDDLVLVFKHTEWVVFDVVSDTTL